MYASVVRLSSIVLEIRRGKLYEGRGQKSGDYRASPCSTGSKSLTSPVTICLWILATFSGLVKTKSTTLIKLY
jgi:hypothetical protein